MNKVKQNILIALVSLVLFLGFSVVSSWALTVGYATAQPIQGGIVTYVTPYQGQPGTFSPSGTPCRIRPACLDAHPRCMIAEPIGGWCTPTPTLFPTPIHCGGFIRNAPVCPTGYVCRLGKIPDAGGTCVPSVTIVPSGIPVAVAANSPVPSTLVTALNGFKSFFTHIFFFWRQ